MNSADKGNIEDYAIKFVVNGEVYDATSYLKDHPGGADSILIMANEDASEDFTAIHSSDAWAKLAEVSDRVIILNVLSQGLLASHRDTSRDIVGTFI